MFDTVPDAVDATLRGETVVVDDEGRENEGAVITAAEFATAKSVSFIVRQATGLLCDAIPQERTPSSCRSRSPRTPRADRVRRHGRLGRWHDYGRLADRAGDDDHGVVRPTSTS